MQDTSSQSTPLSIAALGLGGIGSTLAWPLAGAGHHVTMVARPPSVRLTQLRRDEEVISTDGFRHAMVVADRRDEAIPYHLVRRLLPGLRAYASVRVLRSLADIAPRVAAWRGERAAAS